MIVAVTGISSDLGQTLVPKLQNDSSVERIIGIDINDYRANDDKIQFFKADIRNMDQMASALQNVDVLYHLAFIVAPVNIPDRKTIYDINVNGSKTVFTAAAKSKVKKIIYLSSVAVYGHCPESPHMVTEDAPRLGIKTTNFYYSHTKAIVEEFLDQFEKEHPDIAVIRVRSQSIAGPHYFANIQGLLRFGRRFSKLIYPLNHNGKFPLQMIHEDDLTDALLLMLQKDARGAYNVAGAPIAHLPSFMKNEYNHELSPTAYGVLNVLLAVEKMSAKMGWILAQKYNSLLNTEKVEKEFGWKPRYSTEQCMREFLNSYLKFSPLAREN